jgi:hypothetical protein
MRLGRPVTQIVLSPSERETLERAIRGARRWRRPLALRAPIVLRCAGGETLTSMRLVLPPWWSAGAVWPARWADRVMFWLRWGHGPDSGPAVAMG